MKKKFIILLTVVTLCASTIVCSKTSNTNNTNTTAQETTNTVINSDLKLDDDIGEVTCNINLDSSITVSGTGATVSDNKVTITSSGVYEISGTSSNCQIIVNSESEENVYLVLNNVNLTYENSAPIYVQAAKNAILVLPDGTTNTITDGDSYTFEDSTTDEPNATIFSKDDLNEVKKSLRKAFVVISFLSIPITFGLIGISDKFVPILFGNEFLSVIPLTKISPVLVIIIGLGNVFGTQYLLAIGKNKEYTASVCIGALVNFCFNLLLIPRFAAMGAVIATVSAELSIALIQFWFARVVFDFTWIKETYKYWVSGILMLAIVRLVGNVTPISILFLVLQIEIGSLVYFISLIILRDKFLFEAIENVIDRIRKR